MPSRSLFQYAIITAKGLAMGAADVVPGVSGGTIAFISGIYQELIETIDKLNFGFFKAWRKDGFKTAWKSYNLGFLFALLLGIAISVLSLAKLIQYLLVNHPIAVWSFFFGLIIASILYVGKQIANWNAGTIVAAILATGLSYLITVMNPIGSPEANWFLFIAGFIAIIAMILPGISGAFILLLLGAYPTIVGALSQLLEGVLETNWDKFSEAFIKLFIAGIGAIVGLKVFSGVLNWMFKNYKNIVLAALTGFMIGALNKIWPWKQVLEYRTNHDGEQVPFLEKSILPNQYDGEPQVLFAVLFAILGFLSIFLLERFAARKGK